MAELILESKIEEAFRSVISGSVDAALTAGPLPVLVSLVYDDLATDHVCVICKALSPTNVDGFQRSGHWDAEVEVKVVTDCSGRADSAGATVDLRATHTGRVKAVRDMLNVLGLTNLLDATQTGFSVTGWKLGGAQQDMIGNSWVTRSTFILMDATETDR
jgi:hypothetical protein